MSDALELRALGELMRRMQADIRAMSIKLDLLERRQAQFLTREEFRNDFRDLVEIIAGQLGQHFERLETRLDQTERSVHERLERIEALLRSRS